MLGGYCVLAARPDELPTSIALGPAYRLVDEQELDDLLCSVDPARQAAVREVLAGDVVGVLPGGGVALASEALTRELVRRLGAVWFGLAPENTDPAEMAEELGRATRVVVKARDEWEPGPTVLDFTCSPAVVDRRGKSAILDIERRFGERVRLGHGVAFSVLVVCTGNSCRSPMAAGILRRLLAGLPVFVYSAGTDAPVGAAPTLPAAQVAREYGADISRHRAQQLTPQLVREADLVLVMDRYHRRRVLETEPAAAGRTRLVLSFAGRDETDVEDPIGRSLEFYRRTAAEMLPALEQVAADVMSRLDPAGT
jgi:protein-tyrosine-phosphatase